MLKNKQTINKKFLDNSEFSVFVYANLKKISFFTRMMDFRDCLGMDSLWII